MRNLIYRLVDKPVFTHVTETQNQETGRICESETEVQSSCCVFVCPMQ